MARLIDADALLDAIEGTDWYHISPKGYLERGANSQIHRPLFKADDIFQALKDAPTEDAVEVIRCNNCQNSEPCKPYNKVWCPKMGRYMKQDGFCSEGVMKDAV